MINCYFSDANEKLFMYVVLKSYRMALQCIWFNHLTSEMFIKAYTDIIKLYVNLIFGIKPNNLPVSQLAIDYTLK